MLWNFIKIGYRNLVRQRFYSIINISGLAVGIASFLLIIFYIMDELSFDRPYENHDRIYRMINHIKFGDNEFEGPFCPAPFASTLTSEFPEVENVTRFRYRGTFLVKREIDNYKQEDVAYGDSTFFDLFSYKIINGSAKTALNRPHTVAISSSFAEKLFGEEDAMGQTVYLDNNNEQPFEITAIFADPPKNTHLYFHMLISMASIEEEANNGIWLSNNFNTYVRLKEGTDLVQFEKNLEAMVEKHVYPQAQQLLSNFDESAFENTFVAFYAQPLVDVKLYSNFDLDNANGGQIVYIYLFGAIAFFILLIACINFMNLATARSATRAKEVGLRKVMGSYKRQLIGQFMVESFLVTAFSIVLAIGIVEIMLPYFNEIASKEININYLQEPKFIGVLLLVLVVVSLLAGSYPAFYISGFQPASVLKGKLYSSKQGSFLRKGLVIFQFTIAIFLIIGTGVIYQQLQYVKNTNLGFKKEQVLLVNDGYSLKDNFEAFKNKMADLPYVKSVSATGYLPSDSWRSTNGWFKEGPITEESAVICASWEVDHEYFETMGIELKEGRLFDENRLADSSKVILNEAAVRKFAYEKPLGHEIRTYVSMPDPNDPTVGVREFEVIGVVRDFHYASLRDKIDPMTIRLGDTRGNIILKFQAGHTEELITQAESLYREFAPGTPYQYQFLDEEFMDYYESEERTGRLFAGFSIISIVIACLGLFALSAFTAQQKTKEIGVKKVLGASIGNIIVQLNTEFTKLVAISFIIATPLAWYVTDWWLSGFAYQMDISPLLYVFAGFLTLMISWATTSYQSIRAASANPVNSLRYE